MKFTREQMQALSAYESYFETAVKGNWSRYPGVAALSAMHSALDSVGIHKVLNTNCQSCVLGIIQSCGSIYYQSQVALADIQAEPVKQIAVKTKSRRKTK